MTMPSRCWSLAAVLLLLTVVLVCVLVVDRPLAMALSLYGAWMVPTARAFTDLITVLVMPGLPKWVHPLVLALIGLLLSWRLGSAGLKPFLLTALTLLATRITVTELKGVFERVRPFDYVADPTVADFFKAGHDSFPSGHTAVYMGLLMPVALLFPRWRVPLLLLAGLLAILRVIEGDHYLGDICASALVALVYTLIFGRLLGLRAQGAVA